MTNIINALLSSARRSQYTDFFLFPTIGGGRTPSDSEDSLASYLESLYPAVNLSVTGSYPNRRISMSGSGQYVEFDNFTFGPIVARFRLPSGAVATKAFPLVRKPLLETA